MNIRALLLCLILLPFTGCQDKLREESVPENTDTSIPQTPATSKSTKENWTVEEIAEIANEGNLEKLFTKDAVNLDYALINEGMDKVKVIHLNGESNKEVRIDFWPEDSTTVYRVTVEGKANPVSSKTGVRLGMSIDSLNALNKKSVDFYGFGWDFGGAVIFNEGALEDKSLFVYLKTDEKYGNSFMGDTKHSYEEAQQAKLNLYVYKIMYAPKTKKQL